MFLVTFLSDDTYNVELRSPPNKTSILFGRAVEKVRSTDIEVLVNTG